MAKIVIVEDNENIKNELIEFLGGLWIWGCWNRGF